MKYPPTPRLRRVIRQRRNPRKHQYFGTWIIQSKLTHSSTGKAHGLLRRRINLALERRNNARYEPHAQIAKKDAEEIIDLGERLQKILEEKLEV